MGLARRGEVAQQLLAQLDPGPVGAGGGDRARRVPVARPAQVQRRVHAGPPGPGQGWAVQPAAPVVLAALGLAPLGLSQRDAGAGLQGQTFPLQPLVEAQGGDGGAGLLGAVQPDPPVG